MNTATAPVLRITRMQAGTGRSRYVLWLNGTIKVSEVIAGTTSVKWLR